MKKRRKMNKIKNILILVILVIVLALSMKNISAAGNGTIYVISYIGDIDGSVSEDWYPAYTKFFDFYESNKIPVSFSFYPDSISTDNSFGNIMKKMYSSQYVEIIQKSDEKNFDKLSFNRQKRLIKADQELFKKKMKELGIDNVILPVSYDQINGRFTAVTRKAINELGFKSYFDVFVEEDLEPVFPTENVDVIQYGVGFTRDGGTGRETKFFSSTSMVSQIKNFNRDDVPITTINGNKVIPLWVHQQDFERRNVDNKIDSNKWKIYTETIKKLKADPQIIFVTPKQVYEMRHKIINPPYCGNKMLEAVEECDDGNLVNNDGCSNICKKEVSKGKVCQYATSAVATSDNQNSTGSFASYATGAPNSPDRQSVNQCTLWSGYGYSWSPRNWNIIANLTLRYNTPIKVTNLTVFGDYDMCWDRIWIKNSKTGQLKQVFSGFDESCILTKSVNEDFIADTVILETCGWSWSSTDSVQICGEV